MIAHSLHFASYLITIISHIFLCLYFSGAEPEITTNFQLPPSDPVRPGDSVTLQCSVLFDSEKKTCPGDHSVYWFRAGSDEAHPSFIYAHGNNRDHCKKSPESESTQKCDYFFSKNVSSSDAGTHYCAVATCGEILFGNGTKLEIEGKSGIFLYNCSNFIYILTSNQIIINLNSLVVEVDGDVCSFYYISAACSLAHKSDSHIYLHFHQREEQM
uniref:Ig-like domain-containing protein n=1 Tax=Echeneis naucrates TaxID=173247 RepID=A0A665WD64_ECHNA